MNIEELNPSQVIEAVNGGALFVDVREAYEVDEVAYDLPNMKHIPLGEIQERIEEFPKDQLVIVGCRSGKRSMNACQFLAMKGYDKVKNLSGGIMGWVENGAPVK